jgi:uncharacterized protein (TIGR00299 family) protein
MGIARHPFLYVDAFSGVSGDMVLGALVDLGYPLARLARHIAGLGVDGIRLRKRAVTRGGLAAVQIEVRTADRQPHRGRREIRRILRQARLEPAVRRQALGIFESLIEVESRLHRLPPEKVHLHEVGALDALADVVGTVAALHDLGVREIHASAVNVGSGTVSCEHGELPVPAPAAAALLQGVPVFGAGAGAGERTTPTGAALLRFLATEFGPLPACRIDAIGHGAGTRDTPQRPNLLRLLAGQRPGIASALPAGNRARLVELRCQVDDMDPRLFGHLMERLLAAGARDVYFAPIQMKKNRSGTLVVVLATETGAGNLGRILLDETTTLGYRWLPVERLERPRRHDRVRTPFGMVRVKVTEDEEGETVATPEYEDCRELAGRRGVPLRRVLDEAKAAWLRKIGPARQRTGR